MSNEISHEKIEKLLQALDPSAREQVQRLYESYQASNRKNNLLQLAIDQLPEEIYIKDTESRFVVANATTALINRMGGDEIIGKSDFDIFPPEEAELYRREEVELMAEGKPFHGEPHGKMLERDRPHWFQISKYPLVDEDGKGLGLFGVARHITTEKQTEIMLRAQTEILEMVVANHPLEKIFQQITRLNDAQMQGVASSIMLLDKKGKAFEQVFSTGLPKEYTSLLPGVEIGDNQGSCGTACWRKETVIVQDVETDPYWEKYRDLVRPFGYKSCWSTPLLRSDGSVIGSFALYSKEVRAPSNFEAELFEMGTWLTSIALESHSAAETIRIAAETDALTGLLNRGTLQKELQSKVRRAKRRNSRFSVAFIDLDDFKSVNDRFGHQAGDQYLKAIAERLRGLEKQGCMVARVGGDEFVVLSEVEDNNAQSEQCMVDFIAQLNAPLTIRGTRLNVSSSAGISVYPDHGDTADQLLGKADAAMYYAKTRRSRVKLYDPLIDQDIRDREERVAALRGGIQAGEIDLDFQPQFDITNSRIVGFEALARWQSPKLGRLSPAYFIQLAEENGLIVPLGECTLQLACDRAVAWQRETGQAVPVAVNVSAHQFKDGIIVKQVERALAKSGLNPQYLELELTETLLADTETAANVMSALKAMGVKTALDDFGTGYSNLSALAALPLDRLKIDRSIIQDAPTNTAAEAIASAIIAMGQKLKLQVLAEGVETEEQLAFLAENGCKLVQGYLLSRPVRFEDAVDLLRKSREDATPQAALL